MGRFKAGLLWNSRGHTTKDQGPGRLSGSIHEALGMVFPISCLLFPSLSPRCPGIRIVYIRYLLFWRRRRVFSAAEVTLTRDEC